MTWIIRVVRSQVKPWCISAPVNRRLRTMLQPPLRYACGNLLDHRRTLSTTTESEGKISSDPPTPFVQRENDISKLQKIIRKLYREGKYEDAMESTQLLCDQTAHHFGRMHPVYASALNDQALMLKSQGKYQDAIETYMEALEVYRKAYKGELNQSFAGTLHNLGMAFRSMADQTKGVEKLALLERTKESFQRALEIREEVLPPTHPDVQLTKSRLALVQTLLPRNDGVASEDTESRLRASVDNLQFKVGKVDPSTATAMTNLALFLKGLGRYQEALELYQNVVDIRTELFGPTHVEVIVSMYNKSEAHRAMGDDAAAAQLQ
ncbi:unnamed protein product, partial [Discosporangium mesarthrocarpum]